MSKHAYLAWMATNTQTQWCNDSAIKEELHDALASGAIGCTSNPPLTYLALTETPELYRKAVAEIPADCQGDQRVVALIGIVVGHFSQLLYPLYERSNGEYGYIRSQVQPSLAANREAMLVMGKTIASWGRNIMVKIPGTKAGVWVLEELAALGIPTNPTVCVSVAQILAVAKAHQRGVERAKQAGITPAPSTAAFVMGRLQDYLVQLNQERNAGLSTYDLECAVLAATKRCYQLFNERGYQQVLMPAAFRSARQVAQLVGSKVVMTIHPSIQAEVIKADLAGAISRTEAIDQPEDQDILDRVSEALPEFRQAYHPDGLTIDQFDTYGATVNTLTGFDVTGWQKLRTLAGV